MRRIRPATLIAAGVSTQTLLLLARDRAHRLGRAGRLTGVLTGAVLHTAVGVALRRGGGRVGPADVVTLARATLACTIAGMVVDADVGAARLRSPVGHGSSDVRGPAGILPLSTAALLLDALDRAVARRTGTESAFGARFDGEVDAFLIAVLSVHAARTHGPWVLVAGLARYGFWAAGAVAPWLRRTLPPRPWRKVAAATEGIVLTAANATFVAPRVRTAGLVAGSALIAESFGRDVWWLWCSRSDADRR